MAEELRELRIAKQIPAKEMVEVVRRLYPKYDKTLQSKCENSEDYGICLAADAMNALRIEYDYELLTAQKKRTGERHRLTCRISGRLEDDVYAALQQHMEADGYTTTQKWVTAMALRYIREKEGNAE